MRWRWATAISASCGLVASCSLVTTWDGLTPDDDAGPGDAISASASGAGGDGGAGGSLSATGSGGSAGDAGLDAAHDAAPDGPPVFVCTPKERYCGGDKVPGSTKTLYVCGNDGKATAVEVCTHGCLVRPGDIDDLCRCLTGGSYCGGDHIEGDIKTLYKCNADGSGTVIKHCATSCVVMPGKDDACG